MGNLTASKIKGLTRPGLYGDGGTLYLSVGAGGSKSWVQRLRIGGKVCELGLGSLETVTHAEARESAQANRKIVRAGGDPLQLKREAKRQDAMPTFRVAAEATLAATAPRFRGARTEQRRRGQLQNHAYPVLGEMRLDQIGREDVLRCLTPIWTTKPETARKVRQHVRAVLKWAQAHGHVEINYAGEIIDGALPAMPSVSNHHPALPYKNIAEAMRAIDASGAYLPTKLCLKIIVLTAVRSGEARGAAWREIDIDAATWTIPADRTKTGKEHRVPLSDPALAVLNQAHALSDGGGRLVFPSARAGTTIGSATVTDLLRRSWPHSAVSVHGLRSSFRDWCAENGVNREVAEAALAHTVAGVEAAYFRSDLFARRREVMNSWADYATGAGHGSVVQLHA